MSGLSDRERSLISLRFGLNVFPKPTLDGISAKYKISIERLNEIRDKAELKLRTIYGLRPLILPVSQRVLEVVTRFDRQLVAHFNEHPSEMKTMNRRSFEELVAELWHGFGYEVELTKRTRDGGKDIVAVRHLHVSERFLIECKRPDPGNPIGVETVRALFGVKSDERATKAILATTSYFSPDAHQYFARNRWELEGKDFDGIVDWIRLYLGHSGKRSAS